MFEMFGRRLTGGEIYGVAWSPDSHKLACKANVITTFCGTFFGAPGERCRHDQCRWHCERYLTCHNANEGGGPRGIDWSPDGTLLAVARDSVGFGEPAIQFIDLSGQGRFAGGLSLSQLRVTRAVAPGFVQTTSVVRTVLLAYETLSADCCGHSASERHVRWANHEWRYEPKLPNPEQPLRMSPAAAQAYSLHATLVPSGLLDSLTVWPARIPQPGNLNPQFLRCSSDIEFPHSTRRSRGAVSAFVTGTTHLILDISGFCRGGICRLTAFAACLCGHDIVIGVVQDESFPFDIRWGKYESTRHKGCNRCLVFAFSGWSQGGINASLGGTVSDSTGALIPGVEVTARQTDTGVASTAVTNETGTYRFPACSRDPMKSAPPYRVFKPRHSG